VLDIFSPKGFRCHESSGWVHWVAKIRNCRRTLLVRRTSRLKSDMPRGDRLSHHTAAGNGPSSHHGNNSRPPTANRRAPPRIHINSETTQTQTHPSPHPTTILPLPPSSNQVRNYLPPFNPHHHNVIIEFPLSRAPTPRVSRNTYPLPPGVRQNRTSSATQRTTSVWLCDCRREGGGFVCAGECGYVESC